MTLKKLVEDHFVAVSIFSFIFFIVIPIFLYTNLRDGDESEARKVTNKVAVCDIKTNPTYEWENETPKGYTHTTYYDPIAVNPSATNVEPLAYRRTVYPDYYVNGMPVIDDTVSYRRTNYPNYPLYQNYQAVYNDPRYMYGYQQYNDPYYSDYRNYYEPSYRDNYSWETQRGNNAWQTCGGPNTCNEW